MRYICDEAKSSILKGMNQSLILWLNNLTFFMWCNHYFRFRLRTTRSFSISRYIFFIAQLESGSWEDSFSEMSLSSSPSFNEKETSALFPVISWYSLVSVKTGFRTFYHFGSFSGANPPLRFALSPLCFQACVFPSYVLTDVSRGE